MYFNGIKDGSIDKNLPFSKYDSTGQIVNTGHITAERLKEMYNIFWKKFYLRPRLIGREFIRALSSKHEMTRVARGSVSFYKRVLGPQRV